MNPWVEIPYSQLASQGADGIRAFFETTCLSLEFSRLCANAGFAEAIYHPNHWNVEGRHGPGYEKFEQCLEETKPMLLSCSAKLALVFHGTPRESIAPILKDGLDHKCRSRQAFGNGEYFSKTPGCAERYCDGGLEMMLFVVILPERQIVQGTPKEFVVIYNNKHHLAIGTLQFKPLGLAASALSLSSQRRRRRWTGRTWQIQRKNVNEREEYAKEIVIQELVLDHPDIASELYKAYISILSTGSKREISSFVALKERRLRNIGIAFPDLPPIGREEAQKLRATTLSTAAEHNSPEEFRRLIAASIEERPNSLLSPVPATVVPASYTYITPAGQRAFRIPPMQPVKHIQQSQFTKQTVESVKAMKDGDVTYCYTCTNFFGSSHY